MFVEPWYLLLLVYMVSTASSVQDGVIWAACVSVSILVHEFGHGLAARGYKLQPSIVLHGWGGMTMHAPASRDRHDALIVAAGPAAGLLLGGLVFAAYWIVERAAPGTITANPLLTKTVDSLLFVNLFWSLVNLLPMFPLDGGLLFRLAAKNLLRPDRVARVVHGTGLVLAVGWAVVGSVQWNSMFMVIMGLMFAYQNYVMLSRRAGAAPEKDAAPADTTPVSGPLDEAREALAAGDAREAVRLCHMLRAGGHVPAAVLAETYALIVVANVALGDHEEALSWVRYAPVTEAVVEARLTALLALGHAADARALLAESGALLSTSAHEAFERKLAP